MYVYINIHIDIHTVHNICIYVYYAYDIWYMGMGEHTPQNRTDGLLKSSHMESGFLKWE